MSLLWLLYRYNRGGVLYSYARRLWLLGVGLLLCRFRYGFFSGREQADTPFSCRSHHLPEVLITLPNRVRGRGVLQHHKSHYLQHSTY
jgi:hypothetical protein